MAVFPQSNIDWSKFMNALLGRATIDLDNLTAKGEAKLGKGTIVETYVNGVSGYRLWSDGFCEQWGVIGSNASITYLKPYKDMNYRILLGTHCVYFEGGGINGKSVTGFNHRNGKGWGYEVEWMTMGYIK